MKNTSSKSPQISHSPYVTLFFHFLCLVGFAIEAVVTFNTFGTLSWVQTEGEFSNFWVTPNLLVIIHTGARFVPCMRHTDTVDALLSNGTLPLTLGELCGMGQKETSYSLQWLRFVTANFLHAGLFHLIPNMLIQLYLGWRFERYYGWKTTLGVFLVSGLAGNVMAGFVNPVIQAGVGASIMVCGFIGATLVDFIVRWSRIPNRKRHLFFWLVITALTIQSSFGKGVDGWGHLSGFIFGFLYMIFAVSGPSVDHSKQKDLEEPALIAPEKENFSNKMRRRRLLKLLFGVLVSSLFLTFLMLFYLTPR